MTFRPRCLALLLALCCAWPVYGEEAGAGADDASTPSSKVQPDEISAPKAAPETVPETTPAVVAPKVTATQPTVVAPREQIKAAVKSVLEGPDFSNKKTVFDWRYIGEKEDKEQKPGWFARLLRRLGELMRPLGEGAAFLGEALLWFLALAVVVALALTWRRWIHLFERFRPPQRRKPPTTLFGLDVRPESLPDRPADVALQLWRDGQRRAALGLLYRATLARLIQAHHLDVPDGATEGDCLHLVRRGAAAEIAGLFGDLTAIWLPAAYGERWPQEPQVQDLCQRWNQLFEVHS